MFTGLPTILFRAFLCLFKKKVCTEAGIDGRQIAWSGNTETKRVVAAKAITECQKCVKPSKVTYGYYYYPNRAVSLDDPDH